MDIIIPAGGYATRLRPLTANQAKPLLPIGNKPIIDRIIDRISHVSYNKIFVVTNDKFYTHFCDWKARKSPTEQERLVIVNDHTTSNEDRLGAIGDMQYCVEKHNLSDDILVVAGDNLFDLDVQHLVKKGQDAQSSALGVYDLEDPAKVAKRFGNLKLDENGKVTDFLEKPETPVSSLAATFMYYIHKEDVPLLKACLDDWNKPDNAGDFIKYLMEKKHVHAVPFTGEWHDIGTLPDYKAVHDYYLTMEDEDASEEDLSVSSPAESIAVQNRAQKAALFKETLTDSKDL